MIIYINFEELDPKMLYTKFLKAISPVVLEKIF